MGDDQPGGLHPDATGKVTFYVQVLNTRYQTDHEVPITVTFTSLATTGEFAPIKTYDDEVEHPTPWTMTAGTTGPVVLALDFSKDILSIDMANSAPLLPGYTLVCWTKGEALVHPDTMVDVTNGKPWADLKHVDCLYPG